MPNGVHGLILHIDCNCICKLQHAPKKHDDKIHYRRGATGGNVESAPPTAVLYRAGRRECG